MRNLECVVPGSAVVVPRLPSININAETGREYESKTNKIIADKDMRLKLGKIITESQLAKFLAEQYQVVIDKPISLSDFIDQHKTYALSIEWNVRGACFHHFSDGLYKDATKGTYFLNFLDLDLSNWLAKQEDSVLIKYCALAFKYWNIHCKTICPTPKEYQAKFSADSAINGEMVSKMFTSINRPIPTTFQPVANPNYKK